MTVTLWPGDETLRGCWLWEKSCFLLQTSPKEGAGSPSHRVAKNWAGQAGAQEHVLEAASLLAGRLGGMTSSLPSVSATEALLFQPQV